MLKFSKLIFISFLLLISAQTTFAGRYYDSATGRWITVDPKADKYPNLSPYVYCLNNPLKNVDPDGKDPTGITEGTVAVVGGIAILTAVTIHTFEYTTNSAYRNQYNSYSTSTVHLLNTAVTKIGSFIGNLFSSDEGKTSSEGEEGKSSAIDWSNPPSPEKLGAEWKETTSDKNKTGGYKEYTNIKTGEKVRYDEGKSGTEGYKGKDHYHRYNPNSTSKKDKYLDKNGDPVAHGSSESHLPMNN